LSYCCLQPADGHSETTHPHFEAASSHFTHGKYKIHGSKLLILTLHGCPRILQRNLNQTTSLPQVGSSRITPSQPTMFPYEDPRDPYHSRYRSVSPARNAYERPRPGYYPDDYAQVSPSEEKMPDFSDHRKRGPRNMHFPRGTGGYWAGGAPGEWEHWCRGR
jgi:hypothetical protein